MKKKITCMALCAAMILSLSACGSSSSSSASTPTSDEPITLKFATQHPTDHVAQASAEAIEKAIEEGTEGRVLIDIYPASQLGDYLQVYEEVMRGTIQIAHISGSEQYDPRGGVNVMPGIAAGYSELDKAFGPDSYLAEQLTEVQGDLGIKFMGFYCEGLGGIGTKKEVTDVTNMGADKDVLVRIASLTSWAEATKVMGYKTSNISYSDTYSAIQTGVVDGWVGGPPNLNYMTFRDVINYYYHNSFQTEATQYLMTQSVFDSLSPEDQKVVEDAFAAESQHSFETAQEEDEKYMDMLREEGIEVVTFTDEELKEMNDYIRDNAWPALESEYSAEFIQGLREALQ